MAVLSFNLAVFSLLCLIRTRLEIVTMEKPTDNQLKALDFFRVRYKTSISKDEASQLLEVAFEKAGEEGRREWYQHRQDREPATDFETNFLAYFNITFNDNITHGEVKSIREKIYANPENEKRWRGRKPATTKQKEILAFFNIDSSKGPFYNNEYLSEFEAREVRDTLLSDSANKKRWNKHLKEMKEKKRVAVTDEQKTVLNFFSKNIPDTMTNIEAEELIVSLLIVPKNQTRWDEYQEKTEQKELEKKTRIEEKQWLDDYFDEVNDEPERYDSKNINKKKFKEIIEQLTNDGYTHEQLEDDLDIFYDKAFVLYPELERE